MREPGMTWNGCVESKKNKEEEKEICKYKRIKKKKKSCCMWCAPVSLLAVSLSLLRLFHVQHFFFPPLFLIPFSTLLYLLLNFSARCNHCSDWPFPEQLICAFLIIIIMFFSLWNFWFFKEELNIIFFFVQLPSTGGGGCRLWAVGGQ